MAMRIVIRPLCAVRTLKGLTRSLGISAREVLEQQNICVEQTTLKNGFRVASENNGRPTATVGVWIDAGSRFEHEENNGVAHFLEHMIYKGTDRRSQKQLENELDKIGAKLHSYTSREHTAYYAQCASSDIETVVDILADVLRCSRLNPADIERERHVILRQLAELDENYKEVVFNNMHAAAFQGTPLANSVLGPTKNIESMSKEQLSAYVESNYKPIRMVLTGVGGVDHNKLVKLSEKHFGDMVNAYPEKAPPVERVRFTGSEFLYRDDSIPVMYGAIGVDGVSLSHPDAVPLQIASTIVGQWDQTYASSVNSPSRLAQKVSHGHGLLQFQSFSLNYKDCGLFGMYFVHQAKDLDDTQAFVSAFQKEWKYLTTSVTRDDVERAKNMLKTNVFETLETNAARADDIGRQVLYRDRAQSLAELEKAIEAVDDSMVREAMSRHVYDREVVCAGVGLTEAWPVYARVRYGMSWWRL